MVCVYGIRYIEVSLGAKVNRNNSKICLEGAEKE